LIPIHGRHFLSIISVAASSHILPQKFFTGFPLRFTATPIDAWALSAHNALHNFGAGNLQGLFR
jgi:hypothetical protein